MTPITSHSGPEIRRQCASCGCLRKPRHNMMGKMTSSMRTHASPAATGTATIIASHRHTDIPRNSVLTKALGT